MKYFNLALTILIASYTATTYTGWPALFTCKGDMTKDNTTVHLTQVTNCKEGCNPTQQINFKSTPDCKDTKNLNNDKNLLELVTVGGMQTARCNSFYQSIDPKQAPAVVCGSADNVDYVQLLGDQKTTSYYQLRPAQPQPVKK